MSKWKKGADCNSKNRIRRLKEKLDIEGSRARHDRMLMREVKCDLAQAYREGDINWKLKSKERWLKDGDKNTTFFHGSIQKHRHTILYQLLLTLTGIEKFAEGLKGEIVVEYFHFFHFH